MQSLKYRCPLLRVQLEREEQENSEEPSCKAEMTHRTRGSEEVDAVMNWDRMRSRTLIMLELGMMEEAWLLKEVSTSSLQESVSTGPI